jgi:DNA-binding transcriptional LysR family regulator
MLPLAEEVERAVNALARKVGGDDGRIEGTVRLTSSEVMSGFVLKNMGPLRGEHPALRIEVLSSNRSLDLTRGEADIAVRIAPTAQPDLLVRKVAACGWSLYAASSYADARGVLDDATTLAGHEIIGYDDSLSGVPGALWLAEHGEGATTALRANSIVSALNAALAGLGIAAIPCFLGDVESTLRRMTPTIIGNRDVFVVVHPDTARVARVRAVMDFLVDLYARHAQLLSGVVAAPAAPKRRRGAPG